MREASWLKALGRRYLAWVVLCCTMLACTPSNAARQGKGEIAQPDVSFDALGLEVIDRAHSQAVLEGAERLLDHPQAPVTAQQVPGTGSAVVGDDGV